MRITFNTLAYAVAAVLLIAIAYYALPSLTGGPGPTPTPTPGTGNGGFSPAPRTARLNDTVSVDYAVWVENGSLYDTSIESYARAGGIYQPGVQYAPLNLTLGTQAVIAGFEDAILGMKVGDEVNVSIPPEDAYGEYEATLQQAIPIEYGIPRTQKVPLADFFAVFPGFNFTLNQSVDIGGTNATILTVTNESVTLRSDPLVNQSIERPAYSMPEMVSGLTEEYITIRRLPEEGGLYIWTDDTGNQRLAKAVQIGDGMIMLDFNPPLAGHTLNFTIRLLNITRP